MKKIITLMMIVLSFSVVAKTITDDFLVTKISHNESKKYYEVSLELMAGVYKADDKFLKCLQHSMEKKKAVKITYEAMGLRLTGCEI